MKGRCPWATSPEMTAYHDQEWGVPSHDDRHLFEMLILEGAQAGLSWITILRKRENYRRAFRNFDVAKIAKFTAKDVERLMADQGIVRNRLKIESTILNARLSRRAKGIRLVRPLRLAICEWQAEAKQISSDERSACAHGGIRRDVEGPQETRFQIRRHDDLLCVHAGGRNGE